MAVEYNQTFLNGELIAEDIVEVPDPEPQPVAADTVIASIAAMTDEQKQELRNALGL